MVKKAAGEVSGGEPIRLGDFSDIVDSCDASAAAHVLNHHRRLPRDMFAEMLAEDASFNIGGAAGSKVDDDG
jgi:hypothetical protein